jgi:hypothetical protein
MASETVAPVVGGTPSPQTVVATAASTVEQEIAGATAGMNVYEFVAAGYAHVCFGVAGMGAADLTHPLITPTPRRFKIHSGKVTHLRAIRNGAADVVVSFSRVE